MSMNGINYGAGHADFVNRYRRMAENAQQYGYASQTATNPNAELYDSVTINRIEQNECTDGKDDGKIGFFSAVGNIIEGVGKGALDMVKGALKHPIKTALAIGISCIPVVGPIFMVGMGAYGVYQGGKQIVNAVKIASSATTDAEAKAAFENMGSGGLTVGASALAIKGGAGMLKTQGAQAASVFNGAKANGATTGGAIGEVAQWGMQGTVTNVGNLASATVRGAGKLYQGAKHYIKNPSQIVPDLTTATSGFITRTSQRIGQFADDAINYGKSHFTKAGRAATRQTQIANGTRLDLQNGNYIPNAKGQYQVTMADGSTGIYNSRGILQSSTKTVNGTTTQVTYRNGSPVKTVTTTQNGTVTTVRHGKNTTTTTTEMTGADGAKTTNSSTVNTKTGVNSTKQIDVNGKTVRGSFNSEGTGYSANGEYYLNYEHIPNPTSFQKAQIRFEASNAGVRFNQFADAEMFGLGSNTNPFLYGQGVITTPKEEW